MENTKYVAIRTEGQYLFTDKGYKNCNYLGVSLTSDGWDIQDIQKKIQRG